jgi:CDP-glucose 4,6-dehydratase
VIEPLGGYLLLAAKLATDVPELAGPLNFGPPAGSHCSVQAVIETLLKFWPGSWTPTRAENAPHEAGKLFLNISKAERLLGWTPRWDLETAIQKTVEWYAAAAHQPETMVEFTRRQISDYSL